MEVPKLIEPEEIILTGDDLVVEYVERIVEILKSKEEST